MTKCAAAGCISEGTVSVRPREFRGTEDPATEGYGELTEATLACDEHALLLQRRAAVAPMLTVLAIREEVSAALARTTRLAAGLAEPKDLRLLSSFTTAVADASLATEQRPDPDWQAVAAQLEELRTQVDREILRHLAG